MERAVQPSPTPPERRPFWKNPFFLGFLVGAALLTALPFFQRRSLRAPPPLAQVTDFSLQTPAAPLRKADLIGRVWVTTFCLAPCRLPVPMPEVAKHVTGQNVETVTVVVPGGEGDAPTSSVPNWKVATGAPETIEAFAAPFRDALSRQSGSPPVPDAKALAEKSTFILVDQEGAIRGFWPGDELGKGNVINAAQMIARYGPRP